MSVDLGLGARRFDRGRLQVVSYQVRYTGYMQLKRPTYLLLS